MHSVASFSSYMKYSAMAQPANGAMYCIGAGSEAEASTTIVYSIASNSFSLSTTAATAERVHDPTHQRRPHRHVEHATGAAHLIPLAQHEVVAEDHGPDVVFLQVQRLADDLVSGVRRDELQHLPGHRRRETVDPGDAVLDLQHGPDLAHVDLRQVGGLDLLEEDFFELARSEDGIGGHSAALERL